MRNITIGGIGLVALVVATLIGLTMGAPNAQDAVQGATGQDAGKVTSTEPVGKDQNAAEKSLGEDAIARAAGAEKYLYMFCYKTQDEKTLALQKVFDATVADVTKEANSIRIDISNPAEQVIVDKFGLKAAPMPLVLVLADNGAVTGGFPSKFTKDQLLAAMVSPCLEKCLKGLQDGRLVFVCVQNDKTESNKEAMAGVTEFAGDDKYAKATETVTVDPADPTEQEFVSQIGFKSDMKEAATILLAPPGRMLCRYSGATTKVQFEDALKQSSSGCCPGGAGSAACPPAAK